MRKKNAKPGADKAFDAIGKQLIAAHPADWLALIGVNDAEATAIEVVDADLAAIIPQADRVLLKGGTVPELFNLELETGHHGNLLPERLLFYSIALTHKYKLPVRSAVFLLRKEADSPALTGSYARHHAGGSVYLRFEYDVVRVWRLPVEPLLTGGLATLPLAPIADVPQEQLPSVISRMGDRVRNETKEAQSEFWTATYYLLGTKYTPDIIGPLMKGIGTMFESTTYNATLEKGRAQGINEGVRQGILQGVQQGEMIKSRKLILQFGRKRIGEPPAQIAARLESITDSRRLDDLLERVLTAPSWDDVLA